MEIYKVVWMPAHFPLVVLGGGQGSKSSLRLDGCRRVAGRGLVGCTGLCMGLCMGFLDWAFWTGHWCPLGFLVQIQSISVCRRKVVSSGSAAQRCCLLPFEPKALRQKLNKVPRSCQEYVKNPLKRDFFFHGFLRKRNWPNFS